MNSIEQDIDLINRMLLIAASVNQDPMITKTASIVDSIKEVLLDLKEAVKTRVANEGAGSAVFDYLAIGLLPTKLKLIGGFLSFLGITPSSLFSLIFGTAKKTIDQKGTYTQEDADRDTNSIVNGITVTSSSVNSLEKYASFMNHNSLDELYKKGELNTAFIKQAAPKTKSSPGMFGNPFVYIFKVLTSGEKQSWVMKVLKVIIATVLAGLVGAFVVEGKTTIPSTYEHAIKPGLEKAQDYLLGGKSEEHTSNGLASLPQPIPHDLKPSGKGEETHVNSGDTSWYVKLTNSNIKDTLVYWAVNVYPELKGKEQEIEKASSFNKLTSILNQFYNREELPYYAIPQYPGINTIRNIVDLFAGEVAKSIKE